MPAAQVAQERPHIPQTRAQQGLAEQTLMHGNGGVGAVGATCRARRPGFPGSAYIGETEGHSALKQLREEDLVAIEGQRVVIKDVEGLSRLADFERTYLSRFQLRDQFVKS